MLNMETILGTVVFLIITVAGIPTQRPLSEQDLCRLTAQQATCKSIFHDAILGGRRGGLSSAFQHYCEVIPAFVPCLEDNKDDILLMLECDAFMFRMSPFKDMLTVEEMWNMSISFLNTANGIVCSRTDELVNLVECIKRNKKPVMPMLAQACGRHLRLSSISETIEIADCEGIYGFTTCVKDELVSRCGTDVEDILETVYQDVIIGVIGEGIGCEEEPNPLWYFVRSVRDQLER